MTVKSARFKNVICLLSLLAAITLSTNCYSQIKVYRLVDKSEQADIDRSKFNQLNTLGAGYHLLNEVFKPVKGNYTVYRFIAKYKGHSHRTSKMEVFHDLIILKTNITGTILDAYQYTLEWGEVPLIYDLFTLTVNGLKLHNEFRDSCFQI